MKRKDCSQGQSGFVSVLEIAYVEDIKKQKHLLISDFITIFVPIKQTIWHQKRILPYG